MQHLLLSEWRLWRTTVPSCFVKSLSFRSLKGLQEEQTDLWLSAAVRAEKVENMMQEHIVAFVPFLMGRGDDNKDKH